MMSLEQVISEYQSLYGEPEWRYFKKYVPWSKERGRKTGCHFIPVGDGDEVSKESYHKNVEKSDRIVREAFMGRAPYSYWRYDKKMTKDGWREHLIKDVKAYTVSSKE